MASCIPVEGLEQSLVGRCSVPGELNNAGLMVWVEGWRRAYGALVLESSKVGWREYAAWAALEKLSVGESAVCAEEYR